MNEKRKTIGGEDILTSMQALGFDNYAGVMKVYLSKFRVVSPDPESHETERVLMSVASGKSSKEGGRG